MTTRYARESHLALHEYRNASPVATAELLARVRCSVLGWPIRLIASTLPESIEVTLRRTAISRTVRNCQREAEDLLSGRVRVSL
jgi:hypothetical protein